MLDKINGIVNGIFTPKILDGYKEKLANSLPTFAGKFITVILIVIFSKRIIEYLLNIYKKALRKKGVDSLLESFTVSAIRAIYYIGILGFIISLIGVPAASFATILGAAGLAIGLGLQGSLSNLAGGLLILFFKPFGKDDYISNNNGIDGSVNKIRILYTELITIDNKVIIVPNGQLANNSIINFSKSLERRVDLIFSTSYDTPIDKTIDLLTKIANEHPKIKKTTENRIRLFKHNASSLDYAFRVWVNKEDYWDVFFDCNEIVKKEFDKHGIEIPYQKIDIYNITK
ncbi:MAG: mechanosensitive ion channel family protein [Fusobacteriaceae bacterium]